MAVCSPFAFTLTKGYDNVFTFTVKANGSTLPMEIVAGDTFTASFIALEDLSTVLTKPLAVSDALSGKVTLTLTAADTDVFTGERGSKVDRYYIKPTYKLVIECDTTNNGKFLATVPEVYVN